MWVKPFMPSLYRKLLLVTFLEHKEHIHLSFVPECRNTPTSPHFCLFLICNDNFLQKGIETCQYLLGRCLGGCKHLLIISASRCYSVTGLLQPGTTGGSCPCRWWDGCRVWQRNMNWILNRTRLLLKLMNNVGTEQNISAKTQLSSGPHAPRPPSLFFYEALIFNCFITVGILGELLHAT